MILNLIVSNMVSILIKTKNVINQLLTSDIGYIG